MCGLVANVGWWWLVGDGMGPGTGAYTIGG